MAEKNNHYHCCTSCGTEWGHALPHTGMTQEEYDLRHDCPQCGKNERIVSRFEDAYEQLRFYFPAFRQ